MSTTSFIQQCFDTIEQMEIGRVLTPGGNMYSKLSLRTIRQETQRIAEFSENVLLSEINYEWAETYHIYLLEKGYAKNTVSVLLSRLRFWIRYFHRYGKISYSGAGIRASIELTTQVFHTLDELKILSNIDLEETPGKKRIRDIYICQCFLGLRISDMFRFIRKIDIYTITISDVVFFQIRTQKTGETVIIPASNIVLKIFSDYDNNFGKPFSEWYYNRTIKEIIKNSELEKDVLFYRTEGGQLTERVVSFSDLVSSHTARRTFASNAYLAGIEPLNIMKITGHKSYNSFFRYIRCENTAVAIKIADHEFFKTEL